MLALRSISYAMFAIAAVLMLFGLANYVTEFVGLAVSTAIAGVLILAIDRVILLLTEIRDSLATPKVLVGAQTETASAQMPTLTLEELSAALESRKAAR